MDSPANFKQFGFALDPLGEDIETLGYDINALMEEESALGSLEEALDDRDLRDRYPDAIDQVGELEAAVVLGRLTRLFGTVVLEQGEIEGVGCRAPLVVFEAGDEGGDPVAVAVAYDRLGRCYFRCVPLGGDEATAESIAREFWALVLDDLEDLEDEEARVMDRTSNCLISYGVQDGHPYLGREDAEEEELAEFEEDPFDQERYNDDDLPDEI